MARSGMHMLKDARMEKEIDDLLEPFESTGFQEENDPEEVDNFVDSNLLILMSSLIIFNLFAKFCWLFVLTFDVYTAF